MKQVLPALPYNYAALEPHIDARTMTLHHDQHYALYVANLIRNGVPVICAAALLCAAAGVPAEPVYRQIDAAGRITISTRPDMTFLPPTAVVPARDVTSALASSTAMSTRRAAIVDANEAARRLAQAKREQKQGAERLPGEEAHATDENAVNPKYQRRQDQLRRAVEQAQRRSSEADRKLHARVGMPR